MLPNDYDRINASFELAVTKIQENLQYLVDNDKVSNQFIVMQNLIIKNLIDFQHSGYFTQRDPIRSV